MTLRLSNCMFHCFSLSLNKAGTSYMLREYSSKERKVEDLLELKVCMDLGFCDGLQSHVREKYFCCLHSTETEISCCIGVRQVSLAKMQL